LDEDKEMSILKIILFMALMLILVELLPILELLVSSELYAQLGALVFFSSFILMYFIVDRFAAWDGTTIEKLGFRIDNDTIRHLLIGVIAGIAATALIVGSAFLFGGQLRPIEEISGAFLISEVMITVPTALFEELAHRGYLLPRLEGIAGKNRAILISSLFFSCIHFSWWLTPGVPLHLILLFIFNMFLGGVILSLSYYWSNRKLWVPIGFHFAWNMVGYIMFPTYPRDAVVLPEIYQFEWGITTIIGFLFGLSLIYGLLLNKKK